MPVCDIRSCIYRRCTLGNHISFWSGTIDFFHICTFIITSYRSLFRSYAMSECEVVEISFKKTSDELITRKRAVLALAGERARAVDTQQPLATKLVYTRSTSALLSLTRGAQTARPAEPATTWTSSLSLSVRSV